MFQRGNYVFLKIDDEVSFDGRTIAEKNKFLHNSCI